MKLIDSVFDARTGYHLLSQPAGHFDKHPFGEGNAKIFVILRHADGALPVLRGASDAEGYSATITKMDLAASAKLRAVARRISNAGELGNVYELSTAKFMRGDEGDRKTLRGMFDTRENSILTIGDGKTYAGINTGLAAGSSGDIFEVYAKSGDYNENVSDYSLNGIQLRGMVANQGVRIYSNTTQLIYVSAQEGWTVDNFELDGNSNAGRGVRISSAYNFNFNRLKVHSCTEHGFYVRNADGGRVNNCCVYDSVIGYSADDPWCSFHHCTAVDNSSYGFEGSGGTRASALACIGCDNGTDFYQPRAASCAWNVSKDASAPGSGGSASTFTNADFSNYATNDFTLGTTTTVAKIDGYPLRGRDCKNGIRKIDTQKFFAGWHDPDPQSTGGSGGGRRTRARSHNV